MRAWGWNALGQLGDGTTEDRLSPVAVPGLGGVAGVTAGLAHSVAEGGRHGVVLGLELLHQLGDGTTTTATAPVPVLGLGRAMTVSAGATHTIATGVRP